MIYNEQSVPLPRLHDVKPAQKRAHWPQKTSGQPLFVPLVERALLDDRVVHHDGLEDVV